MRDENLGYLLGLIAMVLFSITLPATRLAVKGLGPVFVGLGRPAGAAFLAGAYLLFTRQPLPTRKELKGLIVVMVGLIFGFPLLTAWAMLYVDASHGAVVLGIQPLATAAAGTLFSREHPSQRFWICALIGTVLVVGYAFSRFSGAIHWADIALFGAIVGAAVGYAEGARLARSRKGLWVISWALVFSAPLLIIPVLLALPTTAAVPTASWVGFIYVMAVSQFLGFIPWFRGLVMGGIAKVGQTQLLQPFLTILASGLLLGEPGDTLTWIVATLVIITVAIGKNAPVIHKNAGPLSLPADSKRRPA